MCDLSKDVELAQAEVSDWLFATKAHNDNNGAANMLHCVGQSQHLTCQSSWLSLIGT